MNEGYDQFSSDDSYDDGGNFYDLDELADGSLQGDDGRYVPAEHFEDLRDRLNAVEDGAAFEDLAAFDQLAAETEEETAQEHRLYRAVDVGLEEVEQELGYTLDDIYADEIGNLALKMSGGGKPDVRGAYTILHGEPPNLDKRSERQAEMVRRIDLLNE